MTMKSFLFGACIALCLAGAASAPRAENASPAGIRQAKPEKEGICIEDLRLSLNGRLLDLRYRVSDFEKASQILKKGTKIVLKDQETGIVHEVPNMPKIGALRQLPRADTPGRTYFMVFSNNEGVGRGAKMTIKMGEVEFPDVVVR